MRTISKALLAVGVMTAIAWNFRTSGPAQAAPAADNASIKWMDSLDAARKVAAKQKKPILIDFSARWCGPCQEMLRGTYKDGKVVERVRKFVPVLIDIDKQHNLSNQYKVDAIPTIIFTDAKGKVLFRQTGYESVDEFLLHSSKALQAAGRVASR